MREKGLVFFLVVGVFLVGVLVSLFLQIRPLAVDGVEAQVKVDKVVGINLDTDKLYFGTVPPGSSAQRGLSIIAPENSFVVIRTIGEYESLFIPEKNYLFLQKGEQAKILFSVVVPESLPIGNYSSLVSISFYRPFVGWMMGK